MAQGRRVRNCLRKRTRFVCREKLEQVLPAAYEHYEQLVPELERMVECRIETLGQLNKVAEGLDTRRRKVNIAKIAGTAAGVGGSTVAAVGIAVSPFVAPVGVPILAGGVAIATLGSSTLIGAHVTEKVQEKVDLEKIRQALDRDEAQCERVSKLWKEFECYSIDIKTTIEKADPGEEPDITSFKTSVQVGTNEITPVVLLIAETFSKVHLELSEKIKLLAGPLDVKSPNHSTDSSTSSPTHLTLGQELFIALGRMAQKMIHKPPRMLCVVSKIQLNILTKAGTVAFLAIAAIGIANLFVLIMTFIDMQKGSRSQVAEKIREDYKKLQEELDKWLDAFGDQETDYELQR